MMRIKQKRKLFVCLAFALMLINTIFFTTASSSNPSEILTNAPMINGKYIATNGCLVADLSYLELIQIANTDDNQKKDEIVQNLQNDGYKFESDTADKENVISQTILFESDFNGKKELRFKYIQNSKGKISVFPDWSEGNFYITNVNNKEYDLLEYENSIYLIYANQGIIEKVLLEDQEYNQSFVEANIKKMDPTYFQLTWGSNPQPNIAGNKFTYYTNRNALKDGGYQGEIRFKNLDTGEDRSFGIIGVNCLGWDPYDNVYYFNYNFDIIKINTNNGNSEMVLESAGPSAVLLYPFIISPNENNNGFNAYSLTKKTTDYIYNDQLKAISNLISNPEKTAVLFQNQFYSTNANRNQAPEISLGMYNVTENTIRFFALPDNYILQGYSWINDAQISIALHNINSSEDNTYIISISDFNNTEQ